MRLLCLSNGHGEDVIAVRILQEFQQQFPQVELSALPIVGEGHAYQAADIPLVGKVQKMPSGGFIYMDGRQLMRDVRGGLLQLTWTQYKAIKAWSRDGGMVLAVGDLVPLLFAWLSGLPYAFVGTAKSEYYLRDEMGWLPRKKGADRLERQFGSVYLPWERWLMKRRNCLAVFPRDRLTTESLQNFKIPAFDLGNPMMDGILPDPPPPIFYDPNAEEKEVARALVCTLLPGSRPPEAYRNWQQILSAAESLKQSFRRREVVFLAAIAPGLEVENLQQSLASLGWQLDPTANGPINGETFGDSQALWFKSQNSRLAISQRAYNDCLILGDVAIAMAGTATEQFIGLGKPAIALPGLGPQYNPAFAEAQTRLLGPSLRLVSQADQVGGVVSQLLRDPDRLQLIAENGLRRMGEPGAALRIAQCLMEKARSVRGAVT